MVEPGEVVIAFGAFSAVVFCVRSIANAAVRFQETKLKAVAPHSELDPAIERRLERIEHAVDSIAIEVERISEGQRFTTRLLSDRASTSSVS